MDPKNIREQLKISTRVMYDELRRQGAKVRVIDATSSMLSYTNKHNNERLLFSTLSDKSSAVGASIAQSKIRTAYIASELGITIPDSIVSVHRDEALVFLESYDRIVLKPVNGSGGVGVSTGITTKEQLDGAYDYANEYSTSVIAQEHVDGDDIRLLIVAGSFASAVRRIPAQVVGDGASDIHALIKIENTSPHRAEHAMAAMDQINLEGAERFLGTSLNRVPMKGEIVRVMGPANLSLGGTVEEATHQVTAEMIADAEKISRKLDLGICGVDMILNTETKVHILIEVNATPGVNMHNDVFWGTSSNAIEKYVSWLIA